MERNLKSLKEHILDSLAIASYPDYHAHSIADILDGLGDLRKGESAFLEQVFFSCAGERAMRVYDRTSSLELIVYSDLPYRSTSHGISIFRSMGDVISGLYRGCALNGIVIVKDTAYAATLRSFDHEIRVHDDSLSFA